MGQKGFCLKKKKDFKNFLNSESDWMALFMILKVYSSSVYIRIIGGLIWNVVLRLQSWRLWCSRSGMGPQNLYFNKHLIQVGWRPHFEKYWKTWSQRSICTSASLSHLFTLKVFFWIFFGNVSKAFLLRLT